MRQEGFEETMDKLDGIVGYVSYRLFFSKHQGNGWKA
jgi:hypothetical protein